MFLFQHEERAFVLKFSAIEIYNEVVRDLLSAENTPLRLWDDAEVKSSSSLSLLIFFFFVMFLFANGLMLFIVQKGTYVENLTEVILRDWNHLKGLTAVCEGEILITINSLYFAELVNIASDLLYMLVIAQRKTGETFLNEKSSRSHQILKLVCLPFTWFYL
jgi:centromeric protein E